MRIRCRLNRRTQWATVKDALYRTMISVYFWRKQEGATEAPVGLPYHKLLQALRQTNDSCKRGKIQVRIETYLICEPHEKHFRQVEAIGAKERSDRTASHLQPHYLGNADDARDQKSNYVSTCYRDQDLWTELCRNKKTDTEYSRLVFELKFVALCKNYFAASDRVCIETLCDL